MIRTTDHFLRSAWGRGMAILLMFSTLYMGYGCVAYKQAPITKAEFLSNQQIQTYLADYKIYVHDDAGTYLLQDVEIVGQADISGRPIASTYDGPKEDWSRKERKAWWNDHKFDIHIYTNGNFQNTVSSETMPLTLPGKVTITENMISEIKVMALDVKKTFSTAVLVAVLVLGAVLLLVLMTIVLVAASDDASDGSITSDSNSDSGGSSDGGSSGS